MTRPMVLRAPDDRWSLKLNPHTLTVTTAMGLALVLVAGLSLGTGSHPASWLEAMSALVAGDDPGLRLVVMEIRLPRVLMAILAGASLGIAGLILQGLVRNPLASPDVIGISSGASAAAVLCLWLSSAAWLVPAAMAGALAVAGLLVTLTWYKGISPGRLVLVGVGLAAGLDALTTLLLVISPDTTAMTAFIWLTGSLYAAQWHDVLGLAPWLLVCLPIVLAKARHLDIQAMGDIAALGLGSAVQRHRLLFLLVAVALTGASVAHVGALGFVGLISPHLARRMVRSGHPGLVMLTAFNGAIILVCADLVGRMAFLPRDLPAGIFVSGIGAPFFVYLLYRMRR
ncbi:FecCD family ABC transporter permease [Marinobacter sp. M1N3S26]|uniref:FecCD family ABC transporter permease n=1 Tax=Marinobacter sp. M1N3S26 TaxID=3382299 RepID=UPI00387A96A1